MRNILVLGSGFAGLWAALGARRRIVEAGDAGADIDVTLINRDEWHAIRVRNYEPDLSQLRVPLAEVLDPAGVNWTVGEVDGIDLGNHTVFVNGGRKLPFDRLILAAGSRLRRPDIPGLSEHAFDIDTFDAAARLDGHLRHLGNSEEDTTVVVVGAGLTGIELACELPQRLREAGVPSPRVILADGQAEIGSDMGPHAKPVIAEALTALGVEALPGIRIASVNSQGLRLADGGRLAAATVVWTAGVEASPLARFVHAPRDRFGRLEVDDRLRVKGQEHVYAVGDIAACPVTDGHNSVMSCQHGRPMGRFGGHNAAADLLGMDQRPLRIDKYVTCLDLGPWGAVYCEGWDRRVIAQGAEAKKIKNTINRQRIYPPRNGNPAEILAAAAPELQPSAGTALAR